MIHSTPQEKQEECVMPAIYTPEWYEAMLKLANSRDDISEKVPQGEWRVAVEVVGDEK
jgi:hypothetical protein